jgi:acetyltransferase
MERHFLDPLFDPRRVAAIVPAVSDAATDALLAGLVAAGDAVRVIRFSGGAAHFDNAGDVDLAIIALPAADVTAALEECVHLHPRAAIVLCPAAGAAEGESWRAIARRHGIHMLGPQSLGLQRPHRHLNAAMLGPMAREGNLALVTQSGALGAAILDWAADTSIGFSAVITTGGNSGVSLAQVLDFLAADGRTQSILLYLEGITNARDFMSALRAAASVKPVLVLKAGRKPEGARAALTHSGAMVGANAVFNAALQRAGAVQVRLFTQLFAAARCLAARYRPCGDRLGVITNGGGPGVLAADWAGESGVRIAPLGEASQTALRKVLPPHAVLDNPLDLGEDAGQAKYTAAIRAMATDRDIDGVLVMYSPKQGVDAQAIVEAVIAAEHDVGKPMIACWMGDRSVRDLRLRLDGAGIPTFRTPEAAVDSFGNIAAFHRNQQLLQQTPPSITNEREPDVEGARMILESVLGERRSVLTEMESKALLAAFHIPVTRTMLARNPNEALMIASQVGYPVAMKISSAAIAHKSDVGGVALNVHNAQEVRARWAEMIKSVKEAHPDAEPEGITIQEMSVKPNGRELHIGLTRDPLFGPVISFGAGGTMIELIRDRAMELPPLNRFLARRLIERTRSAAMLGTFRGMPAAHIAAIEDMLLRVSEMVCELPGLKEMDINPVIVDENGAIAVDARIVAEHAPPMGLGRHAHMAILPYPAYLTEEVPLPDGSSYLIRPIRPEDAEPLQTLVRRLSEEARYFRFISHARELSQRQLARYTQIDYHREMALVATVQEDGRERIVGVARYMLNPDGVSGEYALVVADDWHGRGLGARLMSAIEATARERGLKKFEGFVLGNNQRMLELMRRLGYTSRMDRDDPDLRNVEKNL